MTPLDWNDPIARLTGASAERSEALDRAAAALNIGRRILVEHPTDQPIQVYDADTGTLVIELATDHELAAFIAHYGCTNIA